jgi:hypothetical protein
MGSEKPKCQNRDVGDAEEFYGKESDRMEQFFGPLGIFFFYVCIFDFFFGSQVLFNFLS